MALFNKLKDFQKEVLLKNKDKTKLGLFLDMGLGKTILSLSFCEYFNADAIIVICPKAIAVKQENEKGSFTDHLTNDLNYVVYNKFQKNIKKIEFDKNQKEALILNFESFINIKEEKTRDKIPLFLKKFVFAHKDQKIAIIIDESHRIKNSTPITSKVITNFIEGIEKYNRRYFNNVDKFRLYLLTGTPVSIGYVDIYNQLKFLGLKMTKTKFLENFAVRKNIKSLPEYRRPIKGYKNIDQLVELINNYAVCLRTEDVIELSKIKEEYIELPISREFKLLTQKEILESDLFKFCNKNNIENNYKDDNCNLVYNPFYRNLSYPEYHWFATNSTGGYWLRARQISIGFQGNEKNYKWFDYSRLEKLKELLSKNLDNYIIFYNYDAEYDEILKICQDLEYKIDTWNGKTKTDKYYKEYEKLKNTKTSKNKKRVIIANYASGSTGMNWQKYTNTIWFSVALYKDHVQSMKRNHRIGVENDIKYYVFYQNNFLDKSMIEARRNKKNYTEKMFIKEEENKNSKQDIVQNLKFEWAD
ncbi:SNF2-related protein [Mycoplasma sp. HU2014]|uniref:SNF2-related protein n=1 Tax=Mycoplasma sp. HU2014 TaxID=1664275 RepID=UPI00067BDD22|nr:SNF2-related protein [Mycoplasma sp. HU2014]KNG79671.1 hypothetical protein AB668_00750 [Mycoplasma sp. HU2014]